MQYDVFLSGYTGTNWRKEFKDNISSDISIYDPEDNKIENETDVDTISRNLYYIEGCNIIVFNLLKDSPWCWDELIRLITTISDSVGRGLQVFVCYDEIDKMLSYFAKYLEFRGVHTVYCIDDLITSVEEFTAQLEICNGTELLSKTESSDA